MDLQKIYTDSDFQNAVVPEGQILLFNGTENGKVVTRYKDSSGNFGTLSGGGGGGGDGADVTLGQIDADGNFQPLSFNGTEASNSGNPETVENYYGWNGVLPSPSGGIKVIQGGDAVYYKCASVDTTSKTWSGYLAVCDADGVYTFEGTATTGLTYGTAFTPVAGKIYNADATVSIKQLYMGKDPTLIFHAPLMSSMSAAETGQALTANGDVQYNYLAGRTCAYFSSGDVSITSTIPEFPATGNPLTVMGWFYFDDVWNATNSMFRYGTIININSCDASFRVNGDGYDCRSNSSIESATWVHGAFVSDGTNLYVYVDGVERATTQHTLETTASQTLTLGGNRSGALADVRIYSRALSAEEIYAIAAE